MSDTESAGTARESSVGNQSALLAKMHRLDVTGRIKHLLHAWSSLRTFVSNNDTVAALHLTAENALTGIFLRVEHYGRALEMPDALVHSGSLNDTSVLRYITEKHSQTAVLSVCMLKIADATVGTVLVECAPLFFLTAHLR